MNKQREALEAALKDANDPHANGLQKTTIALIESALAEPDYEALYEQVCEQYNTLAKFVENKPAELEQEPSNVPRQAPISCVRQHGLKYDMPPLYMNASQLRQAVDFLGDDPDGDLELAFAMRDEGKNIDDEIMPAGLYVWCAEYPEEGALYLDGACPPR